MIEYVRPLGGLSGPGSVPNAGERPPLSATPSVLNVPDTIEPSR